MIEKAKCLVVFSDPGVDFGECGGSLGSSKGILGLRQQFDRLLAFFNRVFFPSQTSEHSTEMRVTTGVVGRLTNESLRDRSSLLERCNRLFFIAQMQIQAPFQRSFWTTTP